MIKKLQALKAKKGFTLVELIVVIAIIGVLAAILVPTMLNMVTKSRVTSANSTAKSIADQIDTFLTNADTIGYGMKTSKTVLQEFDILVDAGDWSIPVACTSTNFKQGNGTNITWGTTASGVNTSTSKVGVTSAETLLCCELAAAFPDMKSASIHVSLRGDANVVALAYTADQSTALTTGTDCPAVSAGTGATGEFTSPFTWDTKTAGVSSSGLIVGTCPEIPLG